MSGHTATISTPLCQTIARRATMQQLCRAQTDCALYGHVLEQQQPKPHNKQPRQCNYAFAVHSLLIAWIL